MSQNLSPFDAPETIKVGTRRVACDGDQEKGSGHPRVWLALPLGGEWVECGYCDRRFVYDAALAGPGGDH
ncbi:MAG: zinc-finger domain-containing protein [Paracoccus sp. (in: a-proteobacteria)]|nr:zinc-finger domain-containing protein [Paracoccus sp. (in: a-proteobacteria)]